MTRSPGLPPTCGNESLDGLARLRPRRDGRCAAVKVTRAERPSAETRDAPPGPSGERMSRAAPGRRPSAAVTGPAAWRSCGSLAKLAPAARAWISTSSLGGVPTSGWFSTRLARPAWPGS
ncbi:MAG: hypothetical protein ACRDNT_22765 [Streptosporangiaceae bacterium]